MKKLRHLCHLRHFFDSILNILYGDYVIHHSHITSKIIGYQHNFCNQKVRENKNAISVIAHNLFRFDFFLVMKGLRLCVWRTKNLNIGGKSINDINYVNISDQVKFIDTIKYYQEPLASLAKYDETNEKENIKRYLIIFLETRPKYRFKYTTLTFENRN